MKKNKGFTLVEVIVILVILAILAAVLIPSLTTYIDKAREKSITANARGAYVAAQAVASEQYGVNELYDWAIQTTDADTPTFTLTLVDPEIDTTDEDKVPSGLTSLVEDGVFAGKILSLAQLKEETVDKTTGAYSYNEIDNVKEPKLLFVGVNDGQVGWFAYTEGETGSTQQRWAIHEANGAWTVYKFAEKAAFDKALGDLIKDYNDTTEASLAGATTT